MTELRCESRRNAIYARKAVQITGIRQSTGLKLEHSGDERRGRDQRPMPLNHLRVGLWMILPPAMQPGFTSAFPAIRNEYLLQHASKRLASGGSMVATTLLVVGVAIKRRVVSTRDQCNPGSRTGHYSQHCQVAQRTTDAKVPQYGFLERGLIMWPYPIINSCLPSQSQSTRIL